MKKEQFVVMADGTAGPRFVEVNDLAVVTAETGRWKIYIEAADSSAHKGDVLCIVSSRQEAAKYIGRFVQFYRENRKGVERASDFVKRVGIETARRVLVEDSNGICARLDAEMKGAVQPVRDPIVNSPDRSRLPQFVEILPPVASRAGLFEGNLQTA